MQKGAASLPSFPPAADGNSQGAMQRRRSCGGAGGCAALPVPPCVPGHGHWETSARAEMAFVHALAAELLTEKAGSKDLTPAVLGCLGAVPDTAAVPPCTGGRAAEGLQCLAFTEVCSWLFIAVVG